MQKKSILEKVSFHLYTVLQIPFANDFSCVGRPFEDKLKRKKLTLQHPKINLKTSM